MPTAEPLRASGTEFQPEGMTPIREGVGRPHTRPQAIFPPTAAETLDFRADVTGDASSDESRVPRGLPYAHDTELVQSLTPTAITYGGADRSPETGVVRSPTEYDPVRGVLFSYKSYASIVTDMVKELTEDPAKDDIAYVVVASTT
jgi:hypothetical protein